MLPALDPIKRSVTPFLRWAGSKRKLLPQLRIFWNSRHRRYVEPFAGSSCLFFDLAPPAAILSDNNRDLIGAFEVVRSHPDQVYAALTKIPRTSNAYYTIRGGRVSRSALTRAVRFIYLNRNCFNGIYRTNLAGHFNVPFGVRQGAYPTLADFQQAARLLERAELAACDFADTLSCVRKGDFVYMDPPYALTDRRVFREYGSKAFTVADLDRFATCLRRIDDASADFLVSYADCREARRLAQSWNSRRVSVRRHVAGFGCNRRNAHELLITNMDISHFSQAEASRGQ